MSRYQLSKPVPGYYTSADALNGRNRVSTLGAGSYYVFNRSGRAVNLTTHPSSPGTWIIPPSSNSSRSGSGGIRTKTTKSEGERIKETIKLHSVGEKAEVECYLKNLLTGSSVSFGIPSSLAESLSANYDSQDIRGRSSDVRSYNNTSSRTFSWTSKVHTDYTSGGMYNKLAAIKALAYPEYTGSTIMPPKGFLKIGKVLRTRVTIDNIEISYEKPYREGAYVYAEVSFSCTEISNSPYSTEEVERGAGMRWYR